MRNDRQLIRQLAVLRQDREIPFVIPNERRCYMVSTLVVIVDLERFMPV